MYVMYLHRNNSHCFIDNSNLFTIGLCQDDLGIKSSLISEDNIEVSSFKVTENNPNHGRLNDVSAWCTNIKSHATRFIQVDLDSKMLVSGAITQGNSNSDSWVKTYTVKYAKTLGNWLDAPQEVKIWLSFGLIYLALNDPNMIK